MDEIEMGEESEDCESQCWTMIDENDYAYQKLFEPCPCTGSVCYKRVPGTHAVRHFINRIPPIVFADGYAPPCPIVFNIPSPQPPIIVDFNTVLDFAQLPPEAMDGLETMDGPEAMDEPGWWELVKRTARDDRTNEAMAGEQGIEGGRMADEECYTMIDDNDYEYQKLFEPCP